MVSSEVMTSATLTRKAEVAPGRAVTIGDLERFVRDARTAGLGDDVPVVARRRDDLTDNLGTVYQLVATVAEKLDPTSGRPLEV